MIVKYSFLIFSFILCASYSCQTQKGNQLRSEQTQTVVNKAYFINMYGDTIRKLIKSDAQWKMLLTDQEYYVLREKGTERSFTGDLLSIKDEGLYICRGCSIPLFASKHKFDSGTGWPSFFNVLDELAIHKEVDYNLGYPRTEITCNKCGGHLGHVFDDGPPPTGKRYCINSISLDFIKSDN